MLKGFVYDPVRHPKRGLARRNTVIDQLNNAGFISDDSATLLKATPIDLSRYKKLDENVGIAPYFRMVLADKMKDWCKTHKNPKTGDSYDLYRDGLKIYTTINSTMQEYAEESVEKQMPIIQKKLNYLLKVNGTKIWKGHEKRY